MNTSIETIWKNGFSNEPLQAPKIIDLYNLKSINIVEKTIKRFRLEVWLMIPLAICIFVINIVLDNSNAILWGLVSVIPSLIWFFIGRKQLKSISTLAYQANCYQYLCSIQEKLSDIATFNKRLAILSVPIIFFPMLVYTFLKQQGKTIGEIFGIDGFAYPTYYIFLLLPIASGISYLCATIAWKSIKTKRTASVSALIQEMETLRE